jgi:hypothetical protein
VKTFDESNSMRFINYLNMMIKAADEHSGGAHAYHVQGSRFHPSKQKKKLLKIRSCNKKLLREKIRLITRKANRLMQ